jgi:tRNA A37 N6-isopentenylltransferase MiaA
MDHDLPLRRGAEVLDRKDFWMKYALCVPLRKLVAKKMPLMRSHKQTLHWAFTSLLVSDIASYIRKSFRCCLGYKEFDAYLTSPTDLLFREAVDLMKLSTRQYAKKQISWMRNKLLPAVLQANAEELTTPLYLLDATGL